MGICNRRHFILTICAIQIITTVERQVFDFLGFMWIPILVNFFNIIFVIFGFFGAFQYRPRYVISYCAWNTVWLAWNIFVICFYLNVGTLDKNSDLLNLGTGSFSWWQINGPGCKANYDVTEPELFRPARPYNVTNCVVDYEVVEVVQASTQCILGFIAIVGGICLSKMFLEEDDSFDFVGGGDDFGLAGHTPLHPMYVSYSALPSSHHPPKSHFVKHQYPEGTSSSQRLVPRELPIIKCNDNTLPISRPHDVDINDASSKSTTIDQLEYSNELLFGSFNRRTGMIAPYEDYEDSLESNKSNRANNRYQKNSNKAYYPHSSKYSPVVHRQKFNRQNATGKQQNRQSYRPRVPVDHIREQPLRSYHSDPRLSAATDRNLQVDQVQQQQDLPLNRRKTNRPVSMYAN